MCENVQNCTFVREARSKSEKPVIVSYWSVISGLIAVIVTIVVFYANTISANEQVKDHENRLRTIEKTVTSTEVLLQHISKQVTSIDNKLDKHIEINKK